MEKSIKTSYKDKIAKKLRIKPQKSSNLSHIVN